MIFLSLFLSGVARGACVSPAGVGGTVIFDDASRALQYCNGSQWINFPRSAACDNPQLEFVAGFDTPGNARASALRGNQLFVADGATLRAYNFNGTSITAVTQVAVTDTRGVAANDTHVFAADGTTGVRAFTYNGSAFTAAGTVDTPGSAYRVSVYGNRVFVGDLAGGVRIYTYDGANFTAAGADGGIWTGSVKYDGTYVYAAGADGLRIYDYDGYTLTLNTSFATATGGADIYFDGSYIYLAHSESGISVLTFDGAAITTVAVADTPVYVDSIVVSGNHVIVTDGTGGVISYHFDGSSLTQTQTLPTTDWAQGASIAPPYVFVNANNQGVLAYKIKCSSGISCTLGTVTPRTAAEANEWTAVTYGNGQYVAVARAGTNRVMTSPDGITWTPRSAAQANSWRAITYGNGTFVAVSNDGVNRVMTSPDGITWTARNAAENNGWYGVTYGNGQFVAVANSGTNRVMTSPDGVTWTPRAASQANEWLSVTFGNGLYVAVAQTGTNRVMTSPNGITWTNRTAAESNNWGSVTYGNGRFVAVSTNGTNRVMTSLNGITWAPASAAAANSWYYVAYGDGRFVAVATSGTDRAMTSTDGQSWTALSGAPQNSWYGVTGGPQGFVGVAIDNADRVFTVTCLSNCTNPTEAAGSLLFNNAERVLQWCDGSKWHAAGPINPGGPSGGCSSPSGTAGNVIFNEDHRVVQYCDGGTWRRIGHDPLRDRCSFDSGNIISHWRFDESAGSTLHDSVAGNHGTMANGLSASAHSITGHKGRAMRFNDIGHHINVTNESAFDFTDSFSVSVWVRSSSLSSQYSTVITKGSNFGIQRDNYGNNLRFYVGGLGNSITGAPNNVVDGQWHHIVGVYDRPNTRLRFFVDGVLEETTTGATGTPTTTNDTVRFGNWHGDMWRAWNGDIDDVRIYNIPLSPAQVSEIYAGCGP